VVYRQLGLSGRRYPRDLVCARGAAMDIEVTPGKWRKIPLFSIREDLPEVIPAFNMPERRFAIEKFHPEFYAFDTNAFLQRLEKLESRNYEVRMIYVTRDPIASFSSFMRYQKRNPRWYPTVKGSDLAVYMEKSFASLQYAAERHPGLIIDYSRMVSDLGGTLAWIYNSIWPDQKEPERIFNRHISHAAVKATARDKRSASGTTFLGEKAGSVSGGLDETDPFLVENRDIVARCYNSYMRLLDRNQRNGKHPGSLPAQGKQGGGAPGR
jgi:hypothetical protein